MITVHADEIRIAGEAVARLIVPEETCIAGHFLRALSGLDGADEERQQEIYNLERDLEEANAGIKKALGLLAKDDVAKAIEVLEGLVP